MKSTSKADIIRFDERDNVHARYELIPDTPEWVEYYKRHPELEKKDREQKSLPGIGGVGHILDILTLASMSEVPMEFGKDNVVDGPVSPGKIEMSPERAAEKLKGFAKHLGADAVGIGPLKQEYVYSHVGKLWHRQDGSARGDEINLPHDNAIVLVKQLDFDMLKGAPKIQIIIETVNAYMKLAVIAVTLGRYLRSMGYAARAHTLMNYQIILPPVAIDAGIGELGRHGVLINRTFGSAIKLAAVTTDMPLTHDEKTNLHVDDFCRNCKICAENCPSGAISFGEKRLVRGVERYPFNAEACFKASNINGSDCGVCIATCPWGKPPSLHHAIGIWLALKGGNLPGKLLSKLERMLVGDFDPGKHLQPHWMEEPDPAWKKFRYTRKKGAS